MKKANAAVIVVMLGAAAQAQQAMATTTTPDAIAPYETVTVSGHHSPLEGLWSMSIPVITHFDIFRGIKISKMRDTFCRIGTSQTSLAITCFAFGHGTVDLDHDKIRLDWGDMMGRAVVVGKVESSTAFQGDFIMKIAGIDYTSPEPTVAAKLTVGVGTPDAGRNASLIVQTLRQIAVGETPAFKSGSTTGAKSTVFPPDPRQVRALGTPSALYYLGKVPKDSNKTDADFYSVYDVEFDTGNWLCGIHQDSDQTIDGFRCI